MNKVANGKNRKAKVKKVESFSEQNARFEQRRERQRRIERERIDAASERARQEVEASGWKLPDFAIPAEARPIKVSPFLLHGLFDDAWNAVANGRCTDTDLLAQLFRIEADFLLPERERLWNEAMLHGWNWVEVGEDNPGGIRIHDGAVPGIDRHEGRLRALAMVDPGRDGLSDRQIRDREEYLEKLASTGQRAESDERPRTDSQDRPSLALVGVAS